MSQGIELRINGARLWSRLHELARIGALPNGGCNRQTLTAEDRDARKLFSDWCRNAGCTVSVDPIGNLFARRAGRNDASPVILAGSHLDTQPTGGKFDGVYGVLAALEVVETLNDHHLQTDHSLLVADWCNEEGCRFPAAMMGSAVWAGRMSQVAALALSDPDGATVENELRRLGLDPRQPLGRPEVLAAFEAHIEQGPVLEATACRIGIVTGVQNMSRHEVVLKGQEAHAGPTPMEHRRDPMRALAHLLDSLYKLSDRHGKGARMTVGRVEVEPGSPNTVPGVVRLTVDLRHPGDEAFNSMVAELPELVRQASESARVRGSTRPLWQAPAVRFDPRCINAVREAADELGLSTLEMVSGAGHDSVNIAYVAPSAMIFVPCAGGLSHNEAESATLEDLAAGGNVLLHAILKMDRP